jgi:hypothetical protein
MPHAREVIALRLVELVETERRRQDVKRLAMQDVEDRPRTATGANLIQRGPIAAAPGVGERGPVDGGAPPGVERASLRDDASAPVHTRAEDVEDEGFRSQWRHADMLQ